MTNVWAHYMPSTLHRKHPPFIDKYPNPERQAVNISYIHER